MIFDSQETRKKVLTEFLIIVDFDGWNEDSLSKAIKNCDIDEKFKNLIFEEGCLDLAKFYIEEQNLKSARIIAETSDFSQKKIRPKIRDQIRKFLYARFEVEKNNKIILQRLVNFYLNPKNFTSIKYGPKPLLNSFKSCYKIADFIWCEIGDNSTDFNFYTKRATLAKIILRSLFIFLKDDSNDFEKTKKFIDFEIEKVMKFEKYKFQAKKAGAKVKEAISEFCLNKDGSAKPVKEIFKNLPFIRLL